MTVVSPTYRPEAGGLCVQSVPGSCVSMTYLNVLEDPETHLSYLDKLVVLFGDKSTVLKHDIHVGDHQPIKQHAYFLIY